MSYKRILLKLSGEALMGERQYGIDPKTLADYASEIKQIGIKPKEDHFGKTLSNASQSSTLIRMNDV